MQENNTATPKVVVSMTSFPKAIPYAIGAIRSLLDGSVLPDKLVLYLTFAQFSDESTNIPQELLDLAKANPVFEIRDYPVDLRSYRKLIPALADFPDSIIVTVDDDVHYHRHMLRDLLRTYEKYPHAVIAHRAKRIKPGKPYKKWSKYHWNDFFFKRLHPSFLNLQTGVGGVLYPPHCLKPEMIDIELFSKFAPTMDDIWFWAAAVANGYPTLPVPFGKNKPKGLGKPKSLALKSFNFKSGIDRNLAAFTTILENFPEVAQRVNAE